MTSTTGRIAHCDIGGAKGMPQNFGFRILKKRSGMLWIELIAVWQHSSGNTQREVHETHLQLREIFVRNMAWSATPSSANYNPQVLCSYKWQVRKWSRVKQTRTFLDVRNYFLIQKRYEVKWRSRNSGTACLWPCPWRRAQDCRWKVNIRRRAEVIIIPAVRCWDKGHETLSSESILLWRP